MKRVRCNPRKRGSSEVINVCCPDYEAIENDCVACSIGYTSDKGQMCRRCSNNVYGERCRYECSCSRFEICDNVKGCVAFSLTTRVTRYTAFVTQHSTGRRCQFKTESGEVKLACCADSEAKGKYCLACSKGYTSVTGQKCLPCPWPTYGDRCKFECHCSDFEICDRVDGCIRFSTTNDSPLDTSSYNRTYLSTIKTATYSGNDITDSYREENTNEAITGCSNQGLLSREIIVYSTLIVLVSGFGICLCFVLFKYRTLAKKDIVTISQTRNSLIPQQIQPHETADRLYEIINEEDLLDNRRLQRMQMSSNYLDVIHDSNIREICESNRFVNQDNPCQLLSIDQTQIKDNNLKVDSRSVKSADSTSSSDEYQWDSTQDYLNPYQPMIDISPPAERKYLTIATAHTRKDGYHKCVATVRNEYKQQYPYEVEKEAMTNLYDNNSSASTSFGSNVSKGVSIRKGEKKFKSYENLNAERFKIEDE